MVGQESELAADQIGLVKVNQGHDCEKLSASNTVLAFWLCEKTAAVCYITLLRCDFHLIGTGPLRWPHHSHQCPRYATC